MVAAWRERVAFVQTAPAYIPQIVYRMRDPAFICSKLTVVDDANSSNSRTSSGGHNSTLGDSGACGPLSAPAPWQRSSFVRDTERSDLAIDRLLNASTSRVHASYGRCNEASSYLQLIVQYYHQLPEFVFFIHAHEQSWHSRNITDTLLSLDWPAIQRLNASRPHPFYHSLHGWQYVYELNTERWHMMTAHWQEVFLGQLQASVHYPPYPFAYHCCAHFVVHRSATVARPLSYWRHLYGWCRTTTVKAFYTGRLFEWSWPLLFGQLVATRSADVAITACGKQSTHERCGGPASSAQSTALQPSIQPLDGQTESSDERAVPGRSQVQ